ncbi:TraB/GumN family protein [Melittangium boletus]|uniref:TraB/GumN family protein n=1 Tax=Melittangium boletus TaxID=83453 RepID=UPI003DA43DD4
MYPSRWLLPLVALLTTACATTPAPPPEAADGAASRAFLWEVTRPETPDRPLYLTGSIHVGKPGQYAFWPSMKAALARSQVMVVELDPARVNAAEMQALVTRLGTFTPPDGLSAHLSAETRALLPPALERLRMSPAVAERMRPWMLTLMLAVTDMTHAGYSDQGGVDPLLLSEARDTHRVVELETAEEQLRMFAGMSDAVQEAQLQEQLAPTRSKEDLIARLFAAWESGDPDTLEALVFEKKDDPLYTAYYEALFYARNRRMAERIAALAGGSETAFVVVGAGHLVGEQGLLALLSQKGFTLRQLPRGP